MSFFIFIVIILIIIMFILLINKNSQSEIIKNKEVDIKTKETINPNLSSPYDYLNYLIYAEQKEIDNLKEKNFEDEIKDYILKRAFIYRWRYEKLDYNYYKEMLDKREAKGKYNINKISTSEKKARRKNVLKKTFEVKGAFVAKRRDYILDNVQEGDVIIFKEEPNNKYDVGAIKILHNKNKIGYVAIEEQVYINQLLNQKYVAKISKINLKGNYIDVYYKIESCEKHMLN